MPFEGNKKEQSLESFLDDKKDSTNELNEYIVVNPYNKSKTINLNDSTSNKSHIAISNSLSNSKEIKEEKSLDEKMEFSNEVKLTKKIHHISNCSYTPF